MCMMKLTLHEPAWIDGAPANPSDQCAHGRITLEVDGTTLLCPNDGVFTVSAAALHFMRTITADSTADASVAEGCQFVPCCAHSLYATSAAKYGFAAISCPTGVDIDVEHDGATVMVSRRGGQAKGVATAEEWRQAVIAFACQVHAFYAGQVKVEPPEEERAAWGMFWEEWQALTAGSESRD